MFDLVCLKTGTKPFLLMILKEKEQSKDILDFTHKDEFTAFIYIQHNFILSHPFVCFGIPNLCSSTSAGPHHIVNICLHGLVHPLACGLLGNWHVSKLLGSKINVFTLVGSSGWSKNYIDMRQINRRII